MKNSIKFYILLAFAYEARELLEMNALHTSSRENITKFCGGEIKK